MSRHLPWVGGQCYTVSCFRLWICCISLHYMQSCKAPAMSLRSTLGASLMGYDTSSAAPHMSILECGLPRVGGLTGDSVCVSKDGCSLPLTRGYATHPKLSSSPLGCVEVYAKVASANRPEVCGLLTPNPVRDDFQDSCWVWVFVD